MEIRGGEKRGGGGGVDLYKFLSWFMSVIFLYYFTWGGRGGKRGGGA